MIRVQLGLKNRRLHFAQGQDFFDLRLFEVGKTDGADLPLLIRPFHQPVACDIIACGLMNQQQVYIVGIETGKRLFHRIGLFIKSPLCCSIVTVVPFLACIPAYTSLIADLVSGSL